LWLSWAFFILGLSFLFAVVGDLSRGDMRELAAEVVVAFFAVPSFGLALVLRWLARERRHF
jgi:hypothetical protein